MCIPMHTQACIQAHKTFLIELTNTVTQNLFTGPQDPLVWIHIAWEIQGCKWEQAQIFVAFWTQPISSSSDSFHPATLPELFPINFKAADPVSEMKGDFSLHWLNGTQIKIPFPAPFSFLKKQWGVSPRLQVAGSSIFSFSCKELIFWSHFRKKAKN